MIYTSPIWLFIKVVIFMNIWALPKTTELRLLLLTLDQRVNISRLSFASDEITDANQQELNITDSCNDGLAAYLYTYGQPEGCYGLQLHYPYQPSGVTSPYDPLESLSLDKTVELLCMHFELS
jgi:hypothetical protein